jgi:hypothetical protein
VQAVGAARTVGNPVLLSSNLMVQGSHPLTFTGAVELDTYVVARTVTTSNAARTTFAGHVFGGWLNKAGGGELSIGTASLDRLTVTAGTLRLEPGGATPTRSILGALEIAGGATPAARLDLADNALVIDYVSGSPIQTITAQIAVGYAGGAWTGNGIVSSSAAANPGTHGVGYAEATDLASVPPIFGSIDGVAALVRFTRYGDANLDGTVNLADFNSLASNFGTGDTWIEGDFNYDGLVNLIDFNRLAANFGLTAGADGVVSPGEWAALGSAVPDPAGAVGSLLFGLGMATQRVRRHRRQCVQGARVHRILMN